MPSKRRSRSLRGALLVIAMFALGGLVLWTLFLVPRATSPPVPASATWGAPDRPIRCAWHNVGQSHDVQSIAAGIRPLKPDFVVLSQVASSDLPALAAALGMERSYHPNNYARAQNIGGRKSTWGTAVLSPHPLFAAAAIPAGQSDRDFGVWATAVVDGRKFVVAGIAFSPDQVTDERAALMAAWRQRGSPPIVIAGDPGQIPSFIEAGDSFHASADWRVNGDGDPGWVDLVAASHQR